jgi:hypothetical protein
MTEALQFFIAITGSLLILSVLAYASLPRERRPKW